MFYEILVWFEVKKMVPIFLPVVFYFIQCSSGLPTVAPSPVKTKYEDWESLFGNNITTLVPLLHYEDKSYFFNFNFKATYFQAAQFCEDIHMNLVSIESAEENKRLYKYVRDANKGDLYWTSGAKLMDGKHWIWMSTGRPLEYTNWAPGNPDSQVEHCLAAYHSKNIDLTWADRDCLVQLGFICERRRTKSDVLEPKIPHWSSVYENPYMSVNVPLFHTKDKSYFLGRHFKATFQEAIQICKMMDMHLVAITSKEENDRIYKYIRDTNAVDSFWTSGTRMIDGTTWVWMSTAKLVDYTNWYTGQPDSVTDNCILLMSQKDKGIFWLDSGCLLRYYYICEKPRDVVLFDKRTLLAKRRIDDHKFTYVPLIPMAKRTYYLGNHFKITQLEASNFCKRNNMQLLSIKSEEENEEIRQLLLHHSTSSESFWTSARRASSKDQWTWANGAEVIYSKQNPKDSKEDSLCMEISHNATWTSELCDEELFFICEKSNTTETCPKLAPILNVYVNNDASARNVSLPYAFFKIANATFDTLPEVPELY